MTRTLPFLSALIALGCLGGVAAAQPAPSKDNPDFTKGALVAAGADRNQACRAAKRYRDLISAGQYDQIGSLFSENALYLGPADEPILGADKIGAFYKAFMANHKATSYVASLAPAGARDCYMEMQGTTDTDSPAVVDRFTTDKAGKVIRLCVYFRPSRAKVLGEAAAAALGK
jgi:hypothetical protein